MAGPFKQRQMVYDSWWPSEIGQVLSCSPNFCRVRFPGNKVVGYDKPHMKFLRPVKSATVRGNTKP